MRVHELIEHTSLHRADEQALVYGKHSLTYGELNALCMRVGRQLVSLGVERLDRIGIFLEKRVETVAAMFGSSWADAVFVPINPQLKGEQVAYIMNDCNVRVLVTSKARLQSIVDSLHACKDLQHVIVVDGNAADFSKKRRHFSLVEWSPIHAQTPPLPTKNISIDIAAILYTSGSTGGPKGVVLSHRNITAGARSVSSYLENTDADRILSVLPLSFDYGLNQLMTAFLVGATAVLLNYLLPQDVVKAVHRYRITGLAAVPPLWIQLSNLAWPEEAAESLRYLTNSGGAMPVKTLERLRQKLPHTTPYLMYGLTEAFRSTYLPPGELDHRPESMGKAIPGEEVFVVRDDGTLCDPDEPGELVHRGALVSLGYWNDKERTAERFRPAPGQPQGLPITELAVWSGDTVRMDNEGFLYFVSRQDEMIKTSGYRVSPTEIEEILYETGMVGEVAAFGLADETLGQAIAVIATPKAAGEEVDVALLKKECLKRMPNYMVPKYVHIQESLPRNPNGKLDRKGLSNDVKQLFVGHTP